MMKSKGIVKARKRARARYQRARGRYHVISHEDGWALVREGNRKATKVFEDKLSAISRAKQIVGARGFVYVHTPSGRLDRESSYIPSEKNTAVTVSR